ncbi:hypothetical protein ILUMI_05840, partial [Ignelater luminosus]
LALCFRKIKHPPTSTHHGFYLNDTLRYPAITICRNPPYKTKLFEKYGFIDNKEIEISSTWNSFKFDQYTLQEFFNETTYTFREIFKLTALDKKPENIEVSSLFALHYGRCFTITPKINSKRWGSEYGYFFVFSHTDTTNQESFIGGLSGFHVFIHDEVERFTEKSQQADMFKEYIYVEAGDGIQVNIKMHKYNQLPTSNNKCAPQNIYSKSRCVDDGVNKLITEAVGCSTPWVPNEHLSSCKTFQQTKQIVDYSTPSIYLDRYLEQTQCAERCNATTYTPFLQSIRAIPLPTAAIKIYFSTNLYTVMEEIAGYDWNALLADLGGSLGFLLGLSVISMIGLAEELFSTIIKMKQNRKVNIELNSKSSSEENNKTDTFVKTENMDNNTLQLKSGMKDCNLNSEFYPKKNNLQIESNEKF